MITNILTQIIFYIFALGVIGSALMVVSAKNPVQGVLSLVLCFVAMAGIWILLHAEFLALILIVVYVGAVMTLFLFVVMTLNLDRSQLKRGLVSYLPFGLIIIIFIMIMLFYVVGPAHFGLAAYAAPTAQPANYSNVAALGTTLYSEEVYPFEIAGALLLVAMIAAITLAYRGRRNRKQVKIASQLAVCREDRIKLIGLHSEKKHEDTP